MYFSGFQIYWEDRPSVDASWLRAERVAKFALSFAHETKRCFPPYPSDPAAQAVWPLRWPRAAANAINVIAISPACSLMNGDSATSQTDVWYEWLLHRRHNDNPAEQQVVREATERYADRVLDGARLTPGMTLADIGTGEGLIAFQAIDRIGPSLHVILTDISLPLLRHAERIAVQRDVRRQCTFLECDAEKLSAISDGSVDVVTTRAVLAYVPDNSARAALFRADSSPNCRSGTCGYLQSHCISHGDQASPTLTGRLRR